MSQQTIRRCGCPDGIVEDDCVNAAGICTMCNQAVQTYVNANAQRAYDEDGRPLCWRCGRDQGAHPGGIEC